MNLVKVLSLQLANAHDTLEGTMEGVEQEHMNWLPPGKANSIGSTYAHLVCTEDTLVNSVLLPGDPLMKTTFAGKTGMNKVIPMPGADWEAAYHQWTRTVKTDLIQLREYAKAVYSHTVVYLSSLPETQLSDIVDLSSRNMSSVSKEKVISVYLTAHTNNIAGEISALKGILGLRGYPF